MPNPASNPPSMPLSTPEPMKADMPPAIRKRLIVSGNVQDVGYRAFIKRKARRLGILGFSKNLPDETVEIVCEGTPDALAGFIKSIEVKGDPEDSFSLHVTSINETPPPEGKLTVFYTDYGRKLTEVERQTFDRDEIMVLRAGTLNSNVGVVGQKVDGVGKAVEGVGQKVDGVGKAVEGVGQKVDTVGKAVRDMHSDMNKRFDHMAERYDMIAISLKDAIVHMDRNAEKTDRAIEKSRKETILSVRRSQKDTASMLAKNHKETTAELSMSRKDFAASNRELAGAVKFMIKKLSGKPATVRREIRKKRK
jgi:acylphosphatase